ncbi:hypothetical protein D3C77_585110 [compost metagenome]
MFDNDNIGSQPDIGVPVQEVHHFRNPFSGNTLGYGNEPGMCCRSQPRYLAGSVTDRFANRVPRATVSRSGSSSSACFPCNFVGNDNLKSNQQLSLVFRCLIDADPRYNRSPVQFDSVPAAGHQYHAAKSQNDGYCSLYHGTLLLLETD